MPNENCKKLGNSNEICHQLLVLPFFSLFLFYIHIYIYVFNGISGISLLWELRGQFDISETVPVFQSILVSLDFLPFVFFSAEC